MRSEVEAREPDGSGTDRSPRAPGPLADIPGAAEVSSVAWPILLRRRVQARVHDSDRYRWWVLWSVLTGLFAAGFSFTILAVSIPEIASDLGSSESAVTWAISGPMLMFAIAMPVLGKLGDIHGHRRVYLTGMSLFVLFTALSAAAWSAAALVTVRVIAGIEGAATGPASMALINRAFPAEDRVKAMGFFSLVAAGAPVIGLVVGGVLIDAFGWRALFVFQLPLAAIAVAINAFVLKETPRLPRTRLDAAGAAAVAVAAVSALVALERARALGWDHPVVFGGALLAPIGVYAFVRVERRAVNPLVPLEFFSRRNFSASLVSQFFGNVAYMGGFIISPLLMQHVFGYTVAAAALVMLWRPLSFSLSAPVSGYLATRIGEKTSAIAGESAIALSLVVMALGASEQAVPLVIAGLVLSGVGMGMASPSLQSSLANAVEEEHLGVAGAAQQMVFTVGASAGIAILSSAVAGERSAGPFVDAYLLGAILGSVAVVGSLFVKSFARDAVSEAVADGEAEVAPAV